jgi:hypothetical protein
VARYVALLERKTPDSAVVVKGWSALPPAVKAEIVALVQASGMKRAWLMVWRRWPR